MTSSHAFKEKGWGSIGKEEGELVERCPNSWPNSGAVTVTIVTLVFTATTAPKKRCGDQGQERSLTPCRR